MKSLFFLLVLFSFSVNAQNISGTVTDEKGTPVEYVSVFFDNSTTETQTDANGNFSLSIPENNRNLLVFSAFGYQYYVVENPKPQQNLKITLQLEDNELEELVIDQTAFSRKEFLRAFRHFFIGNTQNAKRTKIVNEEVLSFYFDKNSNTFYAYADEPIKVENKKLGYEILFHLDVFEVRYRRFTLDPNSYSSSHFFGYTQYRDKANGSKKSIKNRQKTYDDSSMAFFSDLVQSNLENSNYVLAVNGLGVNPNEYFDIKKEDNYQLTLKKIPTRKNPIYTEKAVVNGVFNPNLVTEYEEVEVPFVVYNKEIEEQSQLYFQQQTINIDANGNLQNPQAVFFSGYFGDLKVADMLPLDYQPKKKLKKQNLENDPSYLAFEQEAIDFYTSKEYRAYSKINRRFLDLLNTAAISDNQQQFEHWLKQNITQTDFDNETNALDFYQKWHDTFQKIKSQQEDIQSKENLFIEKYGDEFKNKFYPKVTSAVLQNMAL